MSFLSTLKSLTRRKSWTGMVRSVLTEEKLSWSGTDYLSANEISLYVNRALAKRAEKVGEVQFLLTRGEKEVESHPLLDLLTKPNSYMNGADFWSLYQKYKDIVGSVYIWKEASVEFGTGTRLPKALHLLRPDLMKPVVKDGNIESFEYTTPHSGKIITFSPEEIIYSYYPDPMNPFVGSSLLKAGTRAIDTEVQISQYHSKILRNGGKIEGVFKFKTPSLTAAQVKELKSGYESQFSGAAKAGRPLFLGGDAEYQRIGLTPDELSYLEAKNVTLGDICILTGVPKAVLATFDEVQFDNADASIAVFLRETIRPLLNNLTQTLDECFFPDDLDLTFVDPTPENVERKLKVIESGMKYAFLTPNEAREMVGMDAIEGGDELRKMPKLKPGKDDEEEEEEDDDKKSKRKAFEHPFKDELVRKRFGQLHLRRMERFETDFEKQVKKIFDAQEKRLITAVGGQRTFRKKELFGEAFDMGAEIEATKYPLLGLLRNLVMQAGQDAMNVFSDKPFTLNVDILSWVDNRANVLAQELTDTTFERLKQQFEESFDKNEPRTDLIKRIRTTYEGFTTTRARTIARTEVHGAYQEGTMRGYKQAGVPTKIWVAVGDAATRHDHFQADGQEVPIDHPFDVGGEALMYPGDPNGSAANVINCRCVM